MRNLTQNELDVIANGNELIDSAKLREKELMIDEDDAGNGINLVDVKTGQSWDYADVFFN